MRAVEYQKMFEIEDTYWWFVGRRRLTETMLDRHLPADPDARILDFGCGTGANFALFSRYGRVVLQDYYQAPLDFCQQRGVGPLVRGAAERLPFGDGAFDLVAATDVIEHIDDDTAALMEVARVTKPGGHVMLTVPAYMSLWSEHDEALAHKRRYTPRQVRELVEGAGLEIVKLTSYLTVLFPVGVAIRWSQRLLRVISPRRREGSPQTRHFMLPAFANAALIWLQTLEARLARAISLPFGVSIFCLARKGQ